MTNKTVQQTQPLHVENTVLTLGKKDLDINHAFHTFREMKLDGVVSGGMSFIKSMVSKSKFKIGYCADSTAEEKKLIDSLNKSLDNLEDYSKKQLLDNWLQMLDYGCSLNEVVCIREKGRFVFKNISPIHLTTVNKFKMVGGRLKGLDLIPPENDGLLQDVGKSPKSIGGNKVLFFRLEPDSDFPLGKSLLYGAYTAWKTKKILQEYEAIGVAKNLSGVLEIKVPSEHINKYFADPTSNEAVFVDSLLQQAENLHAGKGSYILTASDTNSNGVALFEVSTVGGSGGNAQNYNVGQAIERYNDEIRMNMQTSVLAMTLVKDSSMAIGANTVHLLSLFIESIQETISQEFKKALRIAFELNGLTTERIPSLEFEQIQPISWDEFTKGWQRLLQSGGVTATQDLEDYLRNVGDAPKADYSKKLLNPVKSDESERLGDKTI